MHQITGQLRNPGLAAVGLLSGQYAEVAPIAAQPDGQAG